MKYVKKFTTMWSNGNGNIRAVAAMVLLGAVLAYQV